MKSLVLSFLSIAAATNAFAAVVPAGKFDCTEVKGKYTVNIQKGPGDGYFLNLSIETEKLRMELAGPALIVKVRSNEGGSYNLIRLPGSSIELFYNDAGQLGTSRDRFTCKTL
jgi:hypothetical protein